MKNLDKVKIVFVPTLNGGPAKIKIFPNQTAILTLAHDVWQISPIEVRMFFILHELGHYVKHTSDEIIADRWAFEQYAKTGLSLEKAVHSLSKILNIRNPSHAERIRRQFYRSKHAKFLKTGNIKFFNKQKL